jgi:hypothetical protein
MVMGQGTSEQSASRRNMNVLSDTTLSLGLNHQVPSPVDATDANQHCRLRCCFDASGVSPVKLDWPLILVVRNYCRMSSCRNER